MPSELHIKPIMGGSGSLSLCSVMASLIHLWLPLLQLVPECKVPVAFTSSLTSPVNIFSVLACLLPWSVCFTPCPDCFLQNSVWTSCMSFFLGHQSADSFHHPWKATPSPLTFLPLCLQSKRSVLLSPLFYGSGGFRNPQTPHIYFVKLHWTEKHI